MAFYYSKIGIPPEMTKLIHEIGIDKVVGHICRFGLKSKDDMGDGPVKKPIGLLSNSGFNRDQLSRKYLGGHKHVARLGGGARACKGHPEK